MLEVDVLVAGKMGTRKDLSDCDKSQTVMARRLCQSVSRIVDLVGCSLYAVVSTYRKLSKEEQPVNWLLDDGYLRLVNVCRERRLAQVD